MSNQVDVLDAKGKKAGKVDLPAELFDVQTNIPLIHQVVVAQQAAARQGTHSTKTRGEVRGGGRKPWRQKGTGRARHGSTRSPIWTGGGIVFGPRPRNYSQRTPKKMVIAALRGALSDRARDGQIHVVDEIIAGQKPSTKEALAALQPFGEISKILVVLAREEELAWLSLRNVVDVHCIAVDQLNTYDVVVNEKIIFTKAAIDEFISQSGSQPATKPVAASAPAPKVKAAPKAETKKAKAEEKPAGKDYGKDSFRGENPPAGFDIKGNEDSMKYHTPQSPWYDRTIAEVWFATEAAAEAAGFVNAKPTEEDAK